MKTIQVGGILDNILMAIGSTPLINLQRISADVNCQICVKFECINPSGSLKDRVACRIIEEAEKRGDLRPGMTIIEGTTGNTGIATCMVGAVKGYHVIIVMPEGMSDERKKTILAYGAELVLTPGAETDVDLVLEEVEKIKARYQGQIFEIGQFVRQENIDTHYDTTGPEIWEQTGGRLDAFVMCQGTGGTITGVAKYLKEKNPKMKIFISEPAESPMLARGKIGSHKIQGIADGFIPPILDLGYVDGVIIVSSDDAIAAAQDMAKREGIFCGPSSGINVAAACKLAKHFPELERIVTVVNDNGLRYLSTELCGEKAQRKALNREYLLSPEVIEQLQNYKLHVIE